MSLSDIGTSAAQTFAYNVSRTVAYTIALDFEADLRSYSESLTQDPSLVHRLLLKDGDNPKPLQAHQYETIGLPFHIHSTFPPPFVLPAHQHPHPHFATSIAVPAPLVSIDKMRDPDREHALQCALLTAPELVATHGGELSGDVLALRALAEAVEAAVRG
ncbi:hypothetical protein B0H12DRAFT_1229978 [Mycena haematopus]|nr:hypothetical protein B0H12DRAFT_1229978 [Mycena haematopus]